VSYELPSQPPVLRRRSLGQSIQEELGIGGKEVLQANHSIVAVGNWFHFGSNLLMSLE